MGFLALDLLKLLGSKPCGVFPVSWNISCCPCCWARESAVTHFPRGRETKSMQLNSFSTGGFTRICIEKELEMKSKWKETIVSGKQAGRVMWKAKRILGEQMSWMWIFILDGGLCLKICLFMELLAAGLPQGTKNLPRQGCGAGGSWLWLGGSGRRKGETAAGLAVCSEVMWQLAAISVVVGNDGQQSQLQRWDMRDLGMILSWHMDGIHSDKILRGDFFVYLHFCLTIVVHLRVPKCHDRKSDS